MRRNRREKIDEDKKDNIIKEQKDENERRTKLRKEYE